MRRQRGMGCAPCNRLQQVGLRSLNVAGRTQIGGDFGSSFLTGFTVPFVSAYKGVTGDAAGAVEAWKPIVDLAYK